MIINLSADVHEQLEVKNEQISLQEAQKRFENSAAEILRVNITNQVANLLNVDTFDLNTPKEITTFLLNNYSIFHSLDNNDSERPDYSSQLNKLPESSTVIGKISVKGYHEIIRFFEARGEISKQPKKLPEYLYVIWDNEKHQLKFMCKRKHESFYAAYKEIFGGDVLDEERDWNKEWNPIVFFQNNNGKKIMDSYLDVPTYKAKSDQLDFTNTYFYKNLYQWYTDIELDLGGNKSINCWVTPTLPKLSEEQIRELEDFGINDTNDLKEKNAIQAKYDQRVSFAQGSEILRMKGLEREQIVKEEDGTFSYLLTDDQFITFLSKLEGLEN